MNIYNKKKILLSCEEALIFHRKFWILPLYCLEAVKIIASCVLGLASLTDSCKLSELVNIGNKWYRVFADNRYIGMVYLYPMKMADNFERNIFRKRYWQKPLSASIISFTDKDKKVFKDSLYISDICWNSIDILKIMQISA